MEWVTLHYSKKQIDEAGHVLAQGTGSREEVSRALDVLNNLRAAHSFPLNTIQMNLRRLSRSVHRHPLVAQRLKRVPSMIAKLQRIPKMSLYRMQDIGGCRAVVESATQVKDLKEIFDKSRMKHIRVNDKDYISSPKESGYRGIHLIYRFNSSLNPEHNGRQIEIQIRSKLQHAWATAVETAGTFLQQSLKSSEGEAEWLRFFALTGSLFAIKERTPLVPNVPIIENDLVGEATGIASDLRIPEKLHAYGQAVKTTERLIGTDAFYFLLSINPMEGKLSIRGYKKKELEKASEDYLNLEKSIYDTKGAQAVLVAVDSINALKRSYPNYYLDTQVFMSEYNDIVNRSRKH